MLARWVTPLESRACPAPWREMWRTSTPAKEPRETNASPHGVETGSGPVPSKPGSEWVPEPVMMPMAMAREGTENYAEAVRDPQPVSTDELEDFELACRRAFHDDAHPQDVALDVRTTEADRTLVIREGGEIVATAGALTRDMIVPGGRAVPVGAVTAVGVAPGHTRRGHLGALMRRQLDDIHAAGEPLAILWASEGLIYGRYGYGSATRRVTYDVQRRLAELRRDLPLPGRGARLSDPAEAVPDMRAAHKALRSGRPGLLDRDDLRWERVIYDPEHSRRGFGAQRAVIQPGPDGEPAGYALYAVTEEWDEHGPAGRMRVRELLAATPEAHLGLWRYLLSIDLTRTVSWPRAPDHDPIAHALRNSDAVARRIEPHGLWLRVVDAAPALGAAGRVRELAPGTLAAASTAFGGFAEPYCPDLF